MGKLTNSKDNIEKQLLAPSSEGERRRETLICNWLNNSVNIKTLRQDFQTGNGPADIYLPNKRIVIEVKKKGEALPDKIGGGSKEKETPKEQVTRYIEALKREETLSFPGKGNKTDQFEDWIGMITDCEIWHIYRYDDTGKLRPLTDWKGTKLTEYNILNLKKVFTKQKRMGSRRFKRSFCSFFKRA